MGACIQLYDVDGIDSPSLLLNIHDNEMIVFVMVWKIWYVTPLFFLFACVYTFFTSENNNRDYFKEVDEQNGTKTHTGIFGKKE